MDLADIRSKTREVLDLEATELSDGLIDQWAAEGARLVAGSRPNWPFYEETWTLPVVAGTAEYDLSALVNATNAAYTPSDIVTVRGDDRELLWISRDEADMRFQRDYATQADPQVFYQWGSKIGFAPIPSRSETIQVRGYRKILDWVPAVPTGSEEPDVDAELHNAVLNWVIGAAYYQQEDGQLGGTYFDRADFEINRVASIVERSPRQRPLIMSGRGSRGARGVATGMAPEFGYWR